MRKSHGFTLASVRTCFLSLVAGCLTGLAAAREPANGAEIVILHTNDLHFDFNYLETVQAKIERFRAQYEHVFLLDAGDFSNRETRWGEAINAEIYAERLRFMIRTMNRLGYTAVIPGNHDLCYIGTTTRDTLRLAEFPLLGANVNVETDNFDTLRPFVLLDLNGSRRIAVLGLCGGRFARNKGITLSCASATVREYAFLREKADVLVLLTHIGHPADLKLAAEHGGIVDVIIGGHSHTQANPPVLENGVLVAQTGGHRHLMDPHRRQHLGVVRLKLDEAGRLVEKDGEVLTFDAAGFTTSQFLNAEMGENL